MCKIQYAQERKTSILNVLCVRRRRFMLEYQIKIMNIKIMCVKFIIKLRFKDLTLDVPPFETVCFCGIKIANRLAKQVY